MVDLKYLRIEEHGPRLTHVVMNRPPANALNHEVMGDLEAVIASLRNGGSQVVVLRSEQPMFMAGADLSMVNAGWDSLRSTVKRAQTLMTAWEALPMLTIAAIRGHALGAGCELSLACDFRVMARGNGRIGLPEALRGLLPGAGGTQRMGRLLGRAHTIDMCVRGRMIDADHAERIGLINEAVDDEKLESAVDTLVAELLSLPRLATQAIKRCVVGGLDVSLADGLRIEEDEMTALGNSSDTREGVLSFVEKRKPNFTGD